MSFKTPLFPYLKFTVKWTSPNIDQDRDIELMQRVVASIVRNVAKRVANFLRAICNNPMCPDGDGDDDDLKSQRACIWMPQNHRYPSVYTNPCILLEWDLGFCGDKKIRQGDDDDDDDDDDAVANTIVKADDDVIKCLLMTTSCHISWAHQLVLYEYAVTVVNLLTARVIPESKFNLTLEPPNYNDDVYDPHQYNLYGVNEVFPLQCLIAVRQAVNSLPPAIMLNPITCWQLCKSLKLTEPVWDYAKDNIQRLNPRMTRFTYKYCKFRETLASAFIHCGNIAFVDWIPHTICVLLTGRRDWFTELVVDFELWKVPQPTLLKLEQVMKAYISLLTYVAVFSGTIVSLKSVAKLPSAAVVVSTTAICRQRNILVDFVRFYMNHVMGALETNHEVVAKYRYDSKYCKNVISEAVDIWIKRRDRTLRQAESLGGDHRHVRVDPHLVSFMTVNLWRYRIPSTRGTVCDVDILFLAFVYQQQKTHQVLGCREFDQWFVSNLTARYPHRAIRLDYLDAYYDGVPEPILVETDWRSNMRKSARVMIGAVKELYPDEFASFCRRCKQHGSVV